MKISGIYCLINMVNGKRYVGQSIDIEHRLRLHKNSVNHYKSKNMVIARAIGKYGFDAFYKIMLEYVDIRNMGSIVARKLLNDREQFWLDFCFNKYGEEMMYNICRTSRGVLGIKRSSETRRKMGLAKIGHKYNVGRKLSEETKEKIRQANLGRKMSSESIEKHRAKMIGRKLSDSHRQSLSIAGRKRKHTPEEIAKIRAANIGRIVSQETREKLRKANIGKELSSKTIEKHKANMRSRKRDQFGRLLPVNIENKGA